VKFHLLKLYTFAGRVSCAVAPFVGRSFRIILIVQFKLLMNYQQVIESKDDRIDDASVMEMVFLKLY